MTTAKKKKPIAVLVTTAHKGVFFGYCTNTKADIIALTGARLCVSWSADMEGFMGLASKGPSNSCRIGPAADIDVRDITSVTKVTAEAEKKWLAATW